MSLEFFPCICGELVESLSEHVRQEHVGCDLWRCGICGWEHANLDAVFSHCFKRAHNPSSISSPSLARMLDTVTQIWHSTNNQEQSAPTPPTEAAAGVPNTSCSSQFEPEQAGPSFSSLPPEIQSGIKAERERGSESPDFIEFVPYQQKVLQKSTPKQPKRSRPFEKTSGSPFPAQTCGLCGKKVTIHNTSGAVHRPMAAQHVYSLHLSEFKYWACSKCNSRTSGKASLRQHIARNHLSEPGVKAVFLGDQIEYARVVRETMEQCFPTIEAAKYHVPTE